MEFQRSHDLVQAFRKDHKLQHFVLTDITPTGRVLGTGSYGSVEEVMHHHKVCASKKIHEALINVENEGVAEVVRKYLQECQLMSSLHHPNITQFLGLCFFPGTQLPLLVMERLETSLDDLLEHIPNLPLSLKRSVLEDVASGLLYLHKRQPPVIHRDLTSKNVLLTSSLVAKITDMGNSRIVSMRPGQLVRTLTKYPGTLVYMPPEAQDDKHRYGPSLDIFSFGHLALYTITQVFPGDLLPSTYYNSDNVIRARTELERREAYIELLEAHIGVSHPAVALVQLVKQCLQDIPKQRPSTEKLLTRLQRIKVEVEGKDGGSHPVMPLSKMINLAKEMKEKDRRIEELMQQQARQGRELKDMKRNMEETTQQLEEKDKRIKELMEETTQQLEEKERRVKELQAEVEIGLKLREKSETSDSNSLQLPLQLSWKRGPNMPFRMGGYVQSVVMQRKMYVGAGDADGTNSYRIMEYNIFLEEWGMLPPYRARDFTMTVINNQLVLVGGSGEDLNKVLGVWEADRKEWMHPYPEMPTARSHCSTVVYNEFLVVAGGWAGRHVLSCVEVLNTNTKNWYTGCPMPIPWYNMKTAIVRDMCYFMGGYINEWPTERVYGVPILTLLSKVSSEMSKPTWKEITELQLTGSSPLSMGGFLFAVGGRVKGYKPVSAIHLYQPDTGEWVKVEDLPFPRYDCTCIVIADREVLVAGGHNEGRQKMSRMDLACIM